MRRQNVFGAYFSFAALGNPPEVMIPSLTVQHGWNIGCVGRERMHKEMWIRFGVMLRHFSEEQSFPYSTGSIHPLLFRKCFSEM